MYLSALRAPPVGRGKPGQPDSTRSARLKSTLEGSPPTRDLRVQPDRGNVTGSNLPRRNRRNIHASCPTRSVARSQSLTAGGLAPSAAPPQWAPRRSSPQARIEGAFAAFYNPNTFRVSIEYRGGSYERRRYGGFLSRIHQTFGGRTCGSARLVQRRTGPGGGFRPLHSQRSRHIRRLPRPPTQRPPLPASRRPRRCSSCCTARSAPTPLRTARPTAPFSITVRSSNFDSKALKGMTLVLAVPVEHQGCRSHGGKVDRRRGCRIVKFRAAKSTSSWTGFTASQVIDQGSLGRQLDPRVLPQEKQQGHLRVALLCCQRGPPLI